MEIEELTQCLGDMQEALTSLDKRNQPTIDQATEAKVNSAACLAEVRNMDEDLKRVIALIKESKSIEQTGQLLTAMEGITGNLQLYTDSLKDTLKRFPGTIKTEVSFRFQGRNRTIFIVVTGLALLTALFAGLWSSAWQRDRRLKENDLKYRYLLLQIPAATFRADSLLRHDPRQFETRLEQMEAYQRVQQQARAMAIQKSKEAQEAERKMQRIKRRSK